MILLSTAIFLAQRQWADDTMPSMRHHDRLVHVLGRARVEILQSDDEQALERWHQDLERGFTRSAVFL
ncbi:MAG: hypothetical protein J5I81_12035 [Nitrococcus mobilis]|nr:hypothetical protein [Nitrococcus mobilis]